MDKSNATFIGIPYNRMRAYTLLGDALSREGKPAQARDAYRKALAVPMQSSETDLLKLRQFAWICERLAELPGEDRCARYREASAYWDQWRARGGGPPPATSAPASCR
jgi:hypothetical protein